MICKNCNNEFGDGQHCQYCHIDRIYAGADTSDFPHKGNKTITNPNITNKPQGMISYIPCPHCNEIIDHNSNYCVHCGKEIYQVCPNCNHKHSATNKFCGKCGTNAKEYHQKKLEEEKRRKEEEKRRKLEEEKRRKLEEEKRRKEEERIRERQVIIEEHIRHQVEYNVAVGEINNMLIELVRKKNDAYYWIVSIITVLCLILIAALTSDEAILVIGFFVGFWLLLVLADSYSKIEIKVINKYKKKHKNTIIYMVISEATQRSYNLDYLKQYPWQSMIVSCYKRIHANELHELNEILVIQQQAGMKKQ